MLLVFAGTLFLSALLLFLVQPMVGKMVLPMLGGSPAVWNTCMVFFQAMLLAGYLYAHASTTLLGARKQAAVHLIVMAVPFIVLPIAVNKALAPHGEDNPVIGVLLLLTVAVGLPFFVVSASAPLLQKWFASTDHPAAKDPYFLYAASNLGSMLALAAYPSLVERTLILHDQSIYWMIGYGLLLGATGFCAYLMWKSAPAKLEVVAPCSSSAITAQPARGSTAITARAQKKKHKLKEKPEPEEIDPATQPVTLLRRLHWIGLAFVPSSLLLGATSYITIDIAAIPLLWVLPLSLYLLSFILVFSRLPGWVHKGLILVMPLMVLLLLFFLLSHTPLGKQWQNILLQLVVLFVVAMVLHGELARNRPSTSHLTEFYVWMSVGGVLGGMFNALIAPVVFNSILEYQIALVLACLFMPRLGPEPGVGFGFKIDLAIATTLGVIAFFVFYLGMDHVKDDLKQLLDWEDTLQPENVPAWVIRRIPRLQGDLRTMQLGLWIMLGFVLLAPCVWFLTRDAKLRGWWFDCVLPMGLGLLSAALLLAFYDRNWEFEKLRELVKSVSGGRIEVNAASMAKYIVFGLPALLCYIFVERPLRFGLAVAAFVLAFGMYDLRPSAIIHQDRSYFGVLKVNEYFSDEIAYHSLTHGTTTHGMQCMAEDRRRDPLTYYHRNGPVGQLFATYPELTHNYAVIGLGTGTMAAYGDKDHKVTFYEIDRHVRAIASNPKYFTYLTDYTQVRGEEAEIVMGDARLQMEKANPHEYGMILVDAFSSDAIPAHLITREAVEMLFEKTADNGIVAYHISNRWLDLAPVLYYICKDLGLAALIKHDGGDDLKGDSEWYASTWVALARKPEHLERLTRDEWLGPTSARQMCMVLGGCWPGPSLAALMTAIGAAGERPIWVPLAPPPDLEDNRAWQSERAWTDDFSNILSVFDWKR
jgi:hypothetical protein